MEKAKDLSGLYLLIGALVGFFIALAVVKIFVLPQIFPDPVRGKPSLHQTYTEAWVGNTFACIGAVIGGIAGCKVYSIRQRRRGVDVDDKLRGE